VGAVCGIGGGLSAESLAKDQNKKKVQRTPATANSTAQGTIKKKAPKKRETAEEKEEEKRQKRSNALSDLFRASV
jgi:ribosomal protein L12E/L44/L45/RPP1/RPP2